jgi:hypothetical protein
MRRTDRVIMMRLIALLALLVAVVVTTGDGDEGAAGSPVPLMDVPRLDGEGKFTLVWLAFAETLTLLWFWPPGARSAITTYRRSRALRSRRRRAAAGHVNRRHPESTAEARRTRRARDRPPRSLEPTSPINQRERRNTWLSRIARAGARSFTRQTEAGATATGGRISST